MKIAEHFARKAEDMTLTADQRLHAWAEGYQVERPDLTYAEAIKIACRVNPELHKQYLASNGSR